MSTGPTKENIVKIAYQIDRSHNSGGAIDSQFLEQEKLQKISEISLNIDKDGNRFVSYLYENTRTKVYFSNEQMTFRKKGKIFKPSEKDLDISYCALVMIENDIRTDCDRDARIVTGNPVAPWKEKSIYDGLK